jgi:hypothetical protein
MDDKVEFLTADVLIDNYAYFPASLLKQLATDQPDLCRFDEATGKFYIERGYKLTIEHCEYESLRCRIAKARVIPALDPLARVGDTINKRKMSAEILRDVAASHPDVCYFEDITGVFWVRDDKKFDILLVLAESSQV